MIMMMLATAILGSYAIKNPYTHLTASGYHCSGTCEDASGRGENDDQCDDDNDDDDDKDDSDDDGQGG